MERTMSAGNLGIFKVFLLLWCTRLSFSFGGNRDQPSPGRIEQVGDGKEKTTSSFSAQKTHGIFVAPMTGEYKFYSSCSTHCRVYFGSKSQLKKSDLIIDQTTPTRKNEFKRYPDQASHLIYLEKDDVNFIEAVSTGKRGNHRSHIELGLLLPDDSFQFPISRTILKNVTTKSYEAETDHHIVGTRNSAPAEEKTGHLKQTFNKNQAVRHSEKRVSSAVKAKRLINKLDKIEQLVQDLRHRKTVLKNGKFEEIFKGIQRSIDKYLPGSEEKTAKKGVSSSAGESGTKTELNLPSQQAGNSDAAEPGLEIVVNSESTYDGKSDGQVSGDTVEANPNKTNKLSPKDKRNTYGVIGGSKKAKFSQEERNLTSTDASSGSNENENEDQSGFIREAEPVFFSRRISAEIKKSKEYNNERAPKMSLMSQKGTSKDERYAKRNMSQSIISPDRNDATTKPSKTNTLKNVTGDLHVQDSLNLLYHQIKRLKSMLKRSYKLPTGTVIFWKKIKGEPDFIMGGRRSTKHLTNRPNVHLKTSSRLKPRYSARRHLSNDREYVKSVDKSHILHLTRWHKGAGSYSPTPEAYKGVSAATRTILLSKEESDNQAIGHLLKTSDYHKRLKGDISKSNITFARQELESFDDVGDSRPIQDVTTVESKINVPHARKKANSHSASKIVYNRGKQDVSEATGSNKSILGATPHAAPKSPKHHSSIVSNNLYIPQTRHASGGKETAELTEKPSSSGIRETIGARQTLSNARPKSKSPLHVTIKDSEAVKKAPSDRPRIRNENARVVVDETWKDKNGISHQKESDEGFFLDDNDRELAKDVALDSEAEKSVTLDRQINGETSSRSRKTEDPALSSRVDTLETTKSSVQRLRKMAANNGDAGQSFRGHTLMEINKKVQDGGIRMPQESTGDSFGRTPRMGSALIPHDADASLAASAQREIKLVDQNIGSHTRDLKRKGTQLLNSVHKFVLDSGEDLPAKLDNKPDYSFFRGGKMAEIGTLGKSDDVADRDMLIIDSGTDGLGANNEVSVDEHTDDPESSKTEGPLTSGNNVESAKIVILERSKGDPEVRIDSGDARARITMAASSSAREQTRAAEPAQDDGKEVGTLMSESFREVAANNEPQSEYQENTKSIHPDPASEEDPENITSPTEAGHISPSHSRKPQMESDVNDGDASAANETTVEGPPMDRVVDSLLRAAFTLKRMANRGNVEVDQAPSPDASAFSSSEVVTDHAAVKASITSRSSDPALPIQGSVTLPVTSFVNSGGRTIPVALLAIPPASAQLMLPTGLTGKASLVPSASVVKWADAKDADSIGAMDVTESDATGRSPFRYDTYRFPYPEEGKGNSDVVNLSLLEKQRSPEMSNSDHSQFANVSLEDTGALLERHKPSDALPSRLPSDEGELIPGAASQSTPATVETVSANKPTTDRSLNNFVDFADVAALLRKLSDGGIKYASDADVEEAPRNEVGVGRDTVSTLDTILSEVTSLPHVQGSQNVEHDTKIRSVLGLIDLIKKEVSAMKKRNTVPSGVKVAENS